MGGPYEPGNEAMCIHTILECIPSLVPRHSKKANVYLIEKHW